MWILFSLVDSAVVVYGKYVRQHKPGGGGGALAGLPRHRPPVRAVRLGHAGHPRRPRTLSPRHARRGPPPREPVGARPRAQDRFGTARAVDGAAAAPDRQLHHHRAVAGRHPRAATGFRRCLRRSCGRRSSLAALPTASGRSCRCSQSGCASSRRRAPRDPRLARTPLGASERVQRDVTHERRRQFRLRLEEPKSLQTLRFAGAAPHRAGEQRLAGLGDRPGPT